MHCYEDFKSKKSLNAHIDRKHFNIKGDKWGFGYLIGWFVGGTDCTLQTLYAWLIRGFGNGMVGILIYRVLHLSLRCDSWYTRYVINLVK